MHIHKYICGNAYTYIYIIHTCTCIHAQILIHVCICIYIHGFWSIKSHLPKPSTHKPRKLTSKICNHTSSALPEDAGDGKQGDRIRATTKNEKKLHSTQQISDIYILNEDMDTSVRHVQVTASKAIASETIRRVDPGGGTSFRDMTLYMQPFAHPPQDIASFESRYLESLWFQVWDIGWGMRDSVARTCTCSSSCIWLGVREESPNT